MTSGVGNRRDSTRRPRAGKAAAVARVFGELYQRKDEAAEAPQELSGDRIDSCLDLARNFGLQLVMAFPEDRLPTMIQHAETVVQCRVDRTYDEATGRITDINNWVVKVDREKLLEALS